MRDSAHKHKMIVTIANFSGESGGWQSKKKVLFGMGTEICSLWHLKMMIPLLLALEKTKLGRLN